MVFQDNGGQSFTYRTNIGNSVTDGVELFIQYKFPLTNNLYGSFFTSTSYMHARYLTENVATGGINKSIKGNKVESVPEWLSRNGFDILYKGFSGTILYSYTASSYSDALNTVTPPPSGARGLTPAYSIWDFNASLKTTSIFSFRAGINNILDKKYFTKRPTMYPGAGIWPSDGRNGYFTVCIKL